MCVYLTVILLGISVICTPCVGGGTDEQLIEL